MNLRYLTKAPALAMIIAAENVSFRPPYTAPKNADRRKFVSDLITIVTHPRFPPLGVIVDACAHLCEIVAVLAREFPSPFSTRVLSTLFKHTSNVNNLSISPTFVVGFLLLVFGAAWRKKCYDTLGKFFTFELAVHKEHKLVTTGPYAIVRHPSYTAFLMTDIGCLMAHILPGSYVYECGILDTRWGAICTTLWGILHLFLGLTAVQRVRAEDTVLREEFGSQWDAWAKKTPYALIPYIY